MNAGRNIRQRAFYYTHVFADPNNKDLVYMLNTSAFRSTDGGKTLTAIGGGTHGDHHDLWIDPDDPQHVVLANDGGGTVTYNVALEAAHLVGAGLPTGQFYHVITTKHVPYHVCGAQQDNSHDLRAEQHRHWRQDVYRPTAASAAAARTAATRRWRRIPSAAARPATSRPIRRTPTSSSPAPTTARFTTRLNRRTGDQREVSPYPRFFSGETVERGQGALAVDVPDHLLARRSARALHVVAARLADDQRGQTWTAISGDLTRHDPKTMQDSGGPITHDMNSPEIYATVFSLAPGKTDVNIIWAGSDDGL